MTMSFRPAMGPTSSLIGVWWGRGDDGSGGGELRRSSGDGRGGRERGRVDGGGGSTVMSWQLC
jgi:hypothetical protein